MRLQGENTFDFNIQSATCYYIHTDDIPENYTS